LRTKEQGTHLTLHEHDDDDDDDDTKFYGERCQSVEEKLGSAKYRSGNTTV